VSLRNDVPEGLVVWADSGRLIQVRVRLMGQARLGGAQCSPDPLRSLLLIFPLPLRLRS
jgi:hypothetical protein